MRLPVVPIAEVLSTVAAVEVALARVGREVFHERGLGAGALPAVLAVVLVHALVAQHVLTIALSRCDLPVTHRAAPQRREAALQTYSAP